ncbi:MAG: Gfo/Idh/MocA family protein [Chitinophagales bacterium]
MLPQTSHQSPTTKIRFAIIGFGNIGTRHAQHILNHPNAELTAVCDIDKSKLQLQLIEGKENILLSNDYHHLLQQSNIDVVNVCTPNYLHHPMTIDALKAGKNVVCEKPMAMSSLQCREMIEAAEQNDHQLFVVKQNRYNPPVKVVKELIEEGRLGRVFQVSINCFWNRNANYYLNSTWRGKKDLDGGCLFTQCSHFVDILYYLVGNVEAVSGMIHNFNHQSLAEFEDAGTFLLKGKNGALINFNFSNCSHEQNMEGSITILAEKGTVKIGGQYLNTIDYQNIADFKIPLLPQGKGANSYVGGYKGSMSNHDKVIENVVDTLQGRAEIATNGANGMKVVEIIEAMYESCC